MANTVKRNVVKGAAQDAKLATTVAQAVAQIAAITQSLKGYGLVTLTADQRLHSKGRLKTGESTAMLSIFDTMDARPGLFEVLAPQDHGTDDTAVETEPSRQSLARRDTLAPLLSALETLTQLVSDDVMNSGEQVRDVSMPAYAIIKANASVDAKVSSVAAAAISFYGAPARAKKAKKAKAARATK